VLCAAFVLLEDLILLPLDRYREVRLFTGVQAPVSSGHRRRRGIAMIVRSILIVVVFLLVFSLWGFYSSIRPPRIHSSVTPNHFKMVYEDLSFQTEDGLTLRGWFVPSANAAAKTLILLHGYPADKGNILPPLAFLHDDFNLLFFDFRYLGQSEGRYSTAGAKEVDDLLAAVEFLNSRGIERVGVWGFSMGGAVALMALEKAPAIKAVVSESSYANLGDMASRLFPIPLLNHAVGYLVRLWGKLFLGIDIDEVSPAEGVRNSTIPILVIHSTADHVIPFSHAQALQQALAENPRAEFWFHEDFVHGQLSPEYQTRVREFFRKNL
jgi:uncharacterized protein